MFIIGTSLPRLYRTFIRDNVEPHIYKLHVNNLCLKADVLGPLLERDSYSSILTGNHLIFAPSLTSNLTMRESMKWSPSLGFWILRCGFWIPGFCASGTWFQDYRQQDSGFLRMCSGFPKPRIPDSTASAGFRILSSKNFPDSVIRILFHGATLCNVM